MEVPFLQLSAAIFLLLQIVLSLSSNLPLNSAQSPLCPPTQSLALLQFKNHFVTNKSASNGLRCDQSLPNTESWREGTDCCLWGGVECDESTGNVIRLVIRCLYGQFPTNSSLFQLPHLQTLSLFSNDFNGSLVPSELGRLVSLKNLHISTSNFSGMIPSQISHLSNLISLQIGVDLISFGKAYSLIFDSLTFEMLSKNLTRLKDLYLANVNMSAVNLKSFLNLSASLESLAVSDCLLHGKLPYNVPAFSKLTYLDLSFNKLAGSIPPWLFNLSSLTFLLLSNNQLTEEIPEFESKSLEYISLEHNMLSGSIPVSMFQLPNLTTLYLSSNSLFFGIRELKGFEKLKSLLDLDLSYNNLSISSPNTIDINWPKLTFLILSSCNIAELPMFLRTQDKLNWLDLSNNNIQGDIPQWMMNVGKETLNFLNLSHNHLTGTLQLPWKWLQYLDLHSNMLQGLLPIPPSHLTYIFLSENNFSGEVSSPYCSLSSLEILDLSHNNLSGTIPSCIGNLTKVLLVLNLRRNHFRGTIPTTYTKECALRNLNLQGNQLEGKIPPSLVNCKGLEVLDLGNNLFDDVFPEWLETLPMLRVLVLRSNKLHGHLPNFTANDTFLKLQVLDLSSNSLVGYLPSLENLQAMANVDVSERASTYLGSQFIQPVGGTSYDPKLLNVAFSTNYDYSISLSIKGRDVEMQKIFHVFTSIDISNNAFEGEIPFDMDKLVLLKGLNLSHNNLKGRIPPSIGNLKNLEWLDLSSNKLNGEIPTQLIDVTSLVNLNLSNNQLVGHIPEGKQFNTFTIESYKENSGLCGFPLPRKCRNEESEPPMSSIEDEKTCFFGYGFGWQSVAIGYGCGMVFGVGMGYIMFRYQRPRWLFLIIENKLRLAPQRTRGSRRRNARRNYKF